ncbi:MAG TPA: trimeric intracellular cation channel family protein [Longimicrobiales bacterium]|nr:trimeric intracellular cation channel family protein [Longimicrobiales bacterium]
MTLLQLFDLLGVAVFAVSGALAAVRKRLDLLGVVVIAMVTAIGGGTTRDLLLNRAVFWTTQPRYLYVILVSALLTVFWTRRLRPPDRALAFADALGLALFAISGAQIAERVGLTGIVCVIMGTITGVAGGMIRDVLTTEIPMVIRRGQIYATAAIAGIVAYLLLRSWFGLGEPIAALAGMVVIASLRISAIAWGWTLPVFSLEESGGGPPRRS